MQGSRRRRDRHTLVVLCCLAALCCQPQRLFCDAARGLLDTTATQQQRQQQPEDARWQAIMRADISTWNRLQADTQHPQRHLTMQDELQLLPLMDGGAAAAANDGEAEVNAAAASAVMAAAFAAANNNEKQKQASPASNSIVDEQYQSLGSSSGSTGSTQQAAGAATSSIRAQDADAAAQAAVLASLLSSQGTTADNNDYEDVVFRDDEEEAAQAAAAGSAAASSSKGAPAAYAGAAVSPVSILGSPARAAARRALDQALLSQAPGGSAGRGLFDSSAGLGLEDQLLLARLLGTAVRGDFDEAGRLDPSSSQAYWDLLDRQLEAHPPVKHMFESTFFKCRKLAARPAVTPEELELESQGHIIQWLGLKESQLPRSNEVASFDELVDVLASIGASARIVSDPLPFLTTTTHAALDRNGIPLLIHMTLKDKGRLSRHHMLALASWARQNPDHALLLYDDADLQAYMSLHDAASLELFLSLQTAVERSDLWRYTVMFQHGGVYTDADTLCVRPIQEWNSENAHDAAVLVGVEDVFKRSSPFVDSGWGVRAGRIGVQFAQFTLAGAPGHPVFGNMSAFIRRHIASEATETPPAADADTNWSILHRTGPHPWTDSVLDWMSSKGVAFHESLVAGGRLVDNSTRIMPAETFGCATRFFSPQAQLREVCVMHMFRGAWRKRPSAV